MKFVGALVAMAPFASALVPFGQPAAHQLSVGADRKGAPIVPKSSGLRQPRKASRDKAPGLGAKLASAPSVQLDKYWRTKRSLWSFQGGHIESDLHIVCRHVPHAPLMAGFIVCVSKPMSDKA